MADLLETLETNFKQRAGPFKKEAFVALPIKCYNCKGEHAIHRCNQFLGLSVDERTANYKECKGRSSIIICEERHNSLLHKETLQFDANLATANAHTVLSAVIISITDA